MKADMKPLGICFGHRSCKDLKNYSQIAEKYKFDSIWIAEDLGMRDAIVPLASLAASTKRIRLATGIIPISYRSPALTAMTAATLDEISNGRIILGLGTGDQPWVKKQAIEFRRPLMAMREYVTITRHLLTGKTTNFEGKIFRISQTKLRFKPERRRVPIYVAARGPKMLQLAGEIADGVLNAEGLWTPEHIGWVTENVKLGAEAVGRDSREVEIGSYVLLAVSKDYDRARERAKQRASSLLIGGLLDQQVERMMLHSPDVARLFKKWRRANQKEAHNSIPDELVSKMAIYGTPNDCAKKITEFRRSGVSLPIIIPVGFKVEETLKIATLM